MTKDHPVTCHHLQALESELRHKGITTQHEGKSWWGEKDKNDGGWIYFNCLLDKDSLIKKFALVEPVEYYKWDGRVMGQEAGFQCKEHHSAVMGFHPDYEKLMRKNYENESS